MRGGRAGSRCCWSIQAAHFGKRETRAPGAFPRAKPEEGEDFLTAAVREFREEIGLVAEGKSRRSRLGKAEGRQDRLRLGARGGAEQTISLTSNTFEMEWPPRSRKIQTFPEIDRAEFFPLAEAEKKINESQRMFLERLREKLGC